MAQVLVVPVAVVQVVVQLEVNHQVLEILHQFLRLKVTQAEQELLVVHHLVVAAVAAQAQ